MSLETLAPELVSLILQSVDSPRGLHGLITASPACLRSFSQAPRLILEAVIRNTLPAETVRHFLAVLQTPSPSTTSLVSQFLDKYFDTSSSFDFPTTKADIISLYQLYNRVTYIITRYLHQLQELGLGESILALSDSECIRLQRAFLRFEIYSRVFPADDTYPWETPSLNHQFSAVEQFDLFLSQLAPWEVEEMQCVEIYFSILIGNFIDQLEEQLIDAVKQCTGIVWPSSLGSTGMKEKEEGDKLLDQNNLREFKNLDLTDLSLFSQDGIYYSQSHISYMTSLGLDFIYNLCVSDDKRSELIRSNSPYSRQFFPEALRQSPSWIREIHEDNPHHHNLGWHLYREDPNYGAVWDGVRPLNCDYSSLGQLGYVFWDSGRIRSSDVSERLEAARKGALDCGQFDISCRKGPEDRLKGVRLPRDQFEEIERRFGDIRRPLPKEFN
ncbi:hypothetical protein BKA59DRAFT_528910 [Fusarium tricinctum]|uniref:Uncharacterized protein n=1 Tax=Fusarium tricinctum TaxID=61284 RepID=A0A8K0W9Z3_9HYPO|nr:hypothetical protein BKA59DRAFT_528910 [Fusarium tricinctum]